MKFMIFCLIAFVSGATFADTSTLTESQQSVIASIAAQTTKGCLASDKEARTRKFPPSTPVWTRIIRTGLTNPEVCACRERAFVDSVKPAFFLWEFP